MSLAATITDTDCTEALEFIETLYVAIEGAQAKHGAQCSVGRECAVMAALAELAAQLAVTGIALMAEKHDTAR